MRGDVLLWELANTITEAEICCNMLCASWRTGKASGLRIRGTNGMTHSPRPNAQEVGKHAGVKSRIGIWRPKKQRQQCLKAGEYECHSSRSEIEHTLTPLFCFILVLNELDDACQHWGGQSFLILLLSMCNTYVIECEVRFL